MRSIRLGKMVVMMSLAAFGVRASYAAAPVEITGVVATHAGIAPGVVAVTDGGDGLLSTLPGGDDVIVGLTIWFRILQASGTTPASLRNLQEGRWNTKGSDFPGERRFARTRGEQ